MNLNGVKKQGGLKLSPSNLEATLAENPDLSPYVDRLKKLDTEQKGELELQQVAKVVKDLVETEKSRNLLKNIAILLSLLLLLTLLATAGLTYAIVYLTKDIKSVGGVMIEKSSGDPMVVGAPTMLVAFNSSAAAGYPDLFNASTFIVALQPTQRRRTLLSTEMYCANPKIDPLAVMDVSYVAKRCSYISKQGTNSKFSLVIKGSNNGQCTVADKRVANNTGCGTYRDRIEVAQDQCDIFDNTSLSCTTPGTSYPFGVIWADSVIHTPKHTSYFINCVGTCGTDYKVTFNQCGVSRSQCIP